MIRCLLVTSDGDRYVFMPRVPCRDEIVRIEHRVYSVANVRWEEVGVRHEHDPFDWGMEVVPEQLPEYMPHVYLVQ